MNDMNDMDDLNKIMLIIFIGCAYIFASSALNIMIGYTQFKYLVFIALFAEAFIAIKLWEFLRGKLNISAEHSEKARDKSDNNPSPVKTEINIPTVKKTENKPEQKKNRFYRMEFILKKCKEHHEIYSLVSIADKLIENGFEFVCADIHGGENKTSHPSTFSYNKKYYDLNDLRNKFDSDIDEAREHYDGWASPDYGFVEELLVRGNEKVIISHHLQSDFCSEFYTMCFYGNASENHGLMTDLGNKMFDLLGEDVEFSKNRRTDYFHVDMLSDVESSY